MECLITAGARLRVEEQIESGSSPVPCARKWAKAGVVDFTAAYLFRARDLGQADIAEILALAYEGQARRDLLLAQVLEDRFKGGDVLASGFASAKHRAIMARNKAELLRKTAAAKCEELSQAVST